MTIMKRLLFIAVIVFACMPKPKSLDEVGEQLSGRCVDKNDCGDAFRTCTEKDRYLACVDTAEHSSRNGQYERAIAFMTAGCSVHPYMCEQLGEFGAWQAGITEHHSFERWSPHELELAGRTLRLACSKRSAIGCHALSNWIMNNRNMVDDEAKAALAVACTHEMPFHVDGPLSSDVAGHDDEWFYVTRKTIAIGDAVANSCDILAVNVGGSESDLLKQRALYVRAEADAERERLKQFEASQERARDADFDAHIARLDQQIAEDQQYFAEHSNDIANNLAATRVAIEAIRSRAVAGRTSSNEPTPSDAPQLSQRGTINVPSNNDVRHASTPPQLSPNELDAKCPLPKNRPYLHGYLQHAYAECHNLAFDFFVISGRCGAPTSSECTTARANCKASVAAIVADNEQHNMTDLAVADMMQGWNGEHYEIQDQRVLQSHDDSMNCGASVSEAMRLRDERDAIADRHSAVENEWERWFRWADAEARKCRDSLRR